MYVRHKKRLSDWRHFSDRSLNKWDPLHPMAPLEVRILTYLTL